MRISVVIPTRNRPEFMERVLVSLSNQTRKANEIVIVDSSDEKSYQQILNAKFPNMLSWKDSMASVCKQRNIGIQEASGDWIFLCDDDIELAHDYFEKLEIYCNQDPACGACAGLLLQQEGSEWVYQYPVKGFKDLIWRFVFQLSVWGDLENVRTQKYFQPLLTVVKNFYRREGNDRTLAGWPLITSWNSPVFRTKIYSLGANLIKKQWLLDSPYDEVLDASGIGDNYGVAIGFPHPIHVLSSTSAYHHRATKNRLEKPLTYYRRILALHYFIKKENYQQTKKSIWFIWSLIGNASYFLFRGHNDMAQATFAAIWLLLRGKNPYWQGSKEKQKIVQPFFKLES